MIKLKKLRIILLILTFTSITALFAAPALNLFKDEAPNCVEGELILHFIKGTTYQNKIDTVTGNGGVVREELGMINAMRIRLKKDQDIDDAIEIYGEEEYVEAAQPNYIYHAFMPPPDDRDFDQIWALKNTGQKINNATYIDSEGKEINNPGLDGKDLDLEHAWEIIRSTNGDPNDDSDDVIIAVVDTGVNYNHPDLTDNILKENGKVKGWDFVDRDDDPMDYNGHGTHVAGTIGAKGNNGIGSTGVCWETKIMPVRVLNVFGRGTSADIVNGLNWAIANGADIINLSLGWYYHSIDDHAIRRTIQQTESKVTFIAAAGNDNANLNNIDINMFPCESDFDNVICVAALDQNYEIAGFSNYGNTVVDTAAPGANIFSTWLGKGTVTIDNFHEIDNDGTPYCDWERDTDDDRQWDYATIKGTTGDIDILANPPNLEYSDDTEVRYKKSIKSTVYKNFDLIEGSDINTLKIYSVFDTRKGDYLNIGVKSGKGNPFAEDHLIGEHLSYEAWKNKWKIIWFNYLLPDELKNAENVSVGFQFNTNDDDEIGKGIGIYFFMLTSVDIDATYDKDDSTVGFRVFNGTSMATPFVTGIAALLKAYNPHYTPHEIANAVRNSGDEENHLKLYVKSGKAADAYKALLYVHPPENIRAVIEYE